MKLFLSINKKVLKDIYKLLFNHWKKLLELCVLFTLISSLASIIIAFLITSLGNFLYSEGTDISIDSLLFSHGPSHLVEISTSFYFLNAAIFAVFLLKYKNGIENAKISNVLQLKDAKLYTNWFFGFLFISCTELILFNNFFGFNPNADIQVFLGQFDVSPLDSWLNSILNLFQRNLPTLASIYVVATYLTPKFTLKDSKKIVTTSIITLLMIYVITITYYTFYQDLDTYVFRLLIIPFESPWIYLLIVFSLTIFLQAFLFTFIGGAIAFPLSNNFNLDITDKVVKIENEDILDN